MQGKVEIAGVNTAKLKVLKNDDYSSPLSPWQQPQPSQPQPFQTQPSQPLQRELIWGNDHIMAHDTLPDK